MCKKISINQDKWVEIEEGLGQLRPFEAGEMPRLTHGLCNYCYEVVIADLNDLELRQKDMDSDGL